MMKINLMDNKLHKHIYVEKIILKPRKAFEGTYQEFLIEAFKLAFDEYRTVEIEWENVIQEINPEKIFMEYYRDCRTQAGLESKPNP